MSAHLNVTVTLTMESSFGPCDEKWTVGEMRKRAEREARDAAARLIAKAAEGLGAVRLTLKSIDTPRLVLLDLDRNETEQAARAAVDDKGARHA